MPQVTIGSMLGAVELDAVVVARVGVGRASRATSATARSHASPLRRELAAAQVVERRLVGVDVAAARAALDRHVADGHALFHRDRVDHRARVLVRVADAALHAELADDVRGSRPSRRRPRASLPVTSMRRTFGRASARHCVASTSRTCAGADAERDRAERAVRRGVAVAAAIVMPGCVRPSSGPITCTMPCLPLAGVEEADAELARSSRSSCTHHLLGERVGERPLLRVGRDDVVDGGERALGEAHRQAASRAASRTPAGW